MIVNHPLPHFFSHQSVVIYQKYSKTKESFQQVITYLNSYKTFPSYWWLLWRVEFVNQKGEIFTEGIYCNHHGPMLSAAGILTSVEVSYRDLQYLYGSYVLSFRLFRPLRLQFWFENFTIKCQFDYAIRLKIIAPFFNCFLKFFFKLFLLELGLRAKISFRNIAKG